MKTYDPKKHVLVFAGIPLNKGVADGTFLTIASDGPGFTKKVGVDGEVTRARMHSRGATARLVLMQSSEVNDRLSARYKADRNAVNGQGVGIFSVQDLAGNTVGQASKAWIADDPDVTLEAEASTREWLFDMADWDVDHGGNPDD